MFAGQQTPIVPSVYDYELWLGLRSQLQKYHPGVSFQAIFAPSGAKVDNIVFVNTDRHLDAYQEAKTVSQQ